jgi:predicted MPP superfamily phosphohydrolase
MAILIGNHYKYSENFKNGKKSKKIFYEYQNNNMFTLPENTELLIMSDLHSATPNIIDDLILTKKINKNTIVISTGDMAGNGKMGGDGDPYNEYLKISENAKSFYFVQGNHDIFNKKCKELKNDDGTFCHVEGLIQNTPIGTITGLNGVETHDCRVNKKIHKYSEKIYEKRLKFLLNQKPDILLTHQPIEKKRLSKYHLPKYHLCGHYHIDDFFQVGEYIMINIDGKIINFI